jgi:hypothetical protein
MKGNTSVEYSTTHTDKAGGSRSCEKGSIPQRDSVIRGTADSTLLQKRIRMTWDQRTGVVTDDSFLVEPNDRFTWS